MKIKKITKELFEGDVYNIELESNRIEDDLYWVEGNSGIITHNCFPKDLSSFRYVFKSLGLDTTILDAVITKNNMVRVDRDWERQVGRAVSDE